MKAKWLCRSGECGLGIELDTNGHCQTQTLKIRRPSGDYSQIIHRSMVSEISPQSDLHH